MGLSGVKKRTKISNDPNNLAWAKSTTTFGHKILTSKGWRPGEYLGAKDAAHSDHYTAANASSIRVMLREDNLGLGAQIGKGNAETFGLSMFSGLLGRLNGKSDAELQTQQAAQRDVELRLYQSNKYGTMNFVYGGLLIGDKIEERELKEMIGKSSSETDARGESRKRKSREEVAEEGHGGLKKKKQKKAKRSTGEEEQGHGSNEEILRGDKKGQDGSSKIQENNAAENAGNDESSDDGIAEAPKEKKGRKHKKLSSTDGEKARLKEEKRARKEERRRKKEEKRRKKAEKKAVKAESQEQSSTSTGESESAAAPIPDARAIAAPTINRHAVRHRYIQQKRMASLNPQALKEIFMLQAAS